MTAPYAAVGSAIPVRPDLDLDALAFAADRRTRRALLSDPTFLEALRAYRSTRPDPSGRRGLLQSAVRLSAAMAPTVFAALGHCRRVLGVTAPAEVFCFPDPRINAFLMPPQGQRLLLVFSNGAIERLESAELRFVIGHELGHALYDHFALGHEMLEGDERLAPVQAMRLYAWLRYAELTADRVGLLCCADFEAAVRAFFKLSSGLSDPRTVRHAIESATQYTLLASEEIESDEADWYSTHPYSPLRVRALDLFRRSRAYASLTGTRRRRALGDEALEREVSALLAWMEPSHLHQEVHEAPHVRTFLALGGHAIARADGRVGARERAGLRAMAGTPAERARLDALWALPPARRTARLRAAAKVLRVHASLLRRRRMMEDLAAIAMADGRVVPQEQRVLEELAELLGLEPGASDDALARGRATLD